MDLHGPDVDLGHELVDFGQHGLVVADHQGLGAGVACRRRRRSLFDGMPVFASDVTLTTPTSLVNSGVMSVCSSLAFT